MTTNDTQQVKSLARGLKILDALAAQPHGLSLTDLSRAIDLAPSTVHRLLQTLQSMRYVRESVDGVWQVGIASFEVGSAFFVVRDYARDLHPVLVELANLGETSNLGMLDQHEVVFIGQVECNEVMRMVAPLGSRAPAWASGVGKALLACMDETSLLRCLPADLGPALTGATLTHLDSLQNDLAQARSRGYALDMEERNLGLRCAAAPVFDEFGEARVAISLSGPAARMGDDRIDQLGQKVARKAYQATLALGGVWPDNWIKPE